MCGVVGIYSKDKDISKQLYYSLYSIQHRGQESCGIATSNGEEIDFLRTQTLKINEIMKKFFLKMDLKLVDFKLEFGKDVNGSIILADEISPDTCRLWDVNTNEKLDKDRFRRDLGDLVQGYEEVLARLNK